MIDIFQPSAFSLQPKNLNKKIAIVQSNYIPWKGYFDIIKSVDEFIIYDDIEYSSGTWRNRNRIYTPAGIQWMTIPVRIRGKSHRNIDEIIISDRAWAEKHWKTLVQNYEKAPFFPEYKDYIRELYSGCTERFLSRINYRFITAINKLLGIKTVLRWSSEFTVSGKKSKRLIDICKKTGATTYLSGPAAKGYIDTELFNTEGINVEWVDYSGYREYRQMHLPFEHGVTILDLIFNTGQNARQYMKSFGKYLG